MKKIILSIAFLIATTVHAVVIESNNYDEVLKHIDAKSASDTLVVSDLDNTIIEPVQTLGSDQWGEYMGKKLQAAGIEKETATKMFVSMFSIVQHATQVKTVETSTLKTLDAIAALGVPTLGLTARPLYLTNRSIELLNSVDVKLIGVPEIANLNLEATIKYQNGVVFVGPFNNKGLVLKSILEKLTTKKFKRIIFIDDKVHHAANVDAALKDSNLEVYSIRYGAADKKVIGFNSVIADLQWDTFQKNGIIISDEDALKQINTLNK